MEGTEVEISLACEQREPEQAVITVRDHGRGVPDNALADIFQPFYRVDDARDRKSGGTGLGLAIAARAVRLHGGSVTAKNAIDGGLEVEITLPLRHDYLNRHEGAGASVESISKSDLTSNQSLSS